VRVVVRVQLENQCVGGYRCSRILVTLVQ